ncbi:hypothetical protein BX666DRAFT_919637 [Dichotomocladium elegans]|nr:hypothetical protein BX666DRAFT_919637 [Dichotomocladium elegans]
MLRLCPITTRLIAHKHIHIKGGDDASMAVTNHPYRHTSVDSSSALTKRPDEDGHLEPVTARTSYTSTQTRPSLDQNVKADSASHSSSNSSYPQQSANGVRQADPINNDSPRLGATTTIAHAPPVSPHSDQDRVWISTRNTIPDPKILLSRSAVSQTPAATMMLATQEISDYHGTRPSNGSTVTNDVLPTDDGSSIGNRGVAGDSEHPSAPPELAATPSSPEEPARRSNFQSYLSGMVDSRRGSLKIATSFPLAFSSGENGKSNASSGMGTRGP